MPPAPAPGFRDLPRSARTFVAACVVLAAVTIAVAQAFHDGSDYLAVAGVAALLCIVGNLFEVHGPGRYALQPHLPAFVAAALLAPPILIAPLAALSFATGAIRRGERWYMALFNGANWALAGVVAHLLGTFGGGANARNATAVAGLLAASLAFVIINHALVSIVARLARGQKLLPAVVAAVRLEETAPTGAGVDLALALTGGSLAVLWCWYPAALTLAAGPAALVCASLWVPILRHKSRTDPKTGLFNFEHVRGCIDDALADARRDGTPVSVAMLDLDHLRVVNNRYGHLAGDAMIAGVAGVLERAAAGLGSAGRFGGEEFCVVLPGMSSERAAALLEHVRAEVASLRISSVADGVPSTSISAGIAAYPEHGDETEALLHAADMALYDAKLGGRNRVRVGMPAGGSHALPMGMSAGSARPSTPTFDPPAQTISAGAAFAADDQPRADAEPDEPGRRNLIPWFGGTLIGVALLVGGFADVTRVVDAPLLFVALIASMVVLDAARIDLFERLQTSPAGVPVIALAAMFGPLGPLAGEAAIALTRAVRREDPPVRYMWDFGALSLAGAGAAAVFNAVPASGADYIAVGAVAGLAYYAINIPLLAVVITLSRGGSPLANFREQLAWLLPHYLAFGSFAGLFVLVHDRMGWNAFLLFGLPTGLLWIAEHQYLERSRASVEELRRRHGELEDANTRLRRLLADNQALLGRLQQSYLSTITSLARTIEAKDPYTGGHTERVSRVAATLAIELGFSAEDLRAVEVGAVIHDIGKIGVSDATLLKAGPLTDDERLDIQRHPEISSYILAELDVPAIVKQMVRSHHERYDGRGYPDNLAGEEIPLSARILTVADALDAMTSNRPYRPAMPLNDALKVIEENVETQFCPVVVAALRRCLEHDSEFAADDSATVLERSGARS